MNLPKRVLFTLHEAAARWNCQIADIADWALSGHLEIMMAIPPTSFGDEMLSDLVVIAPSDILAMFRRDGSGPREMVIRRARALGGGEWQHIAALEDGLRVTREDLMLLADGLARFEEEHGMFRRVGTPPARGHDWDGFYGALILRIFRGGLPEKQAELVDEMQRWFISSSLGRRLRSAFPARPAPPMNIASLMATRSGSTGKSCAWKAATPRNRKPTSAVAPPKSCWHTEPVIG